MENPTTTGPDHIPESVAKQIEDIKRMGFNLGIPLVITLDKETIAALNKGEPKTVGQDFAVFAAKAVCATMLGVGGALTVFYITRPAEPV